MSLRTRCFYFAFLVRIAYPLLFSGSYFSDLNYWCDGRSELPVWIGSLVGGILGALVGGGSLWVIGEIWQRLRGVEAMGLGDVKMMLGVGALLGWRLSFLSIFLAAFAGTLDRNANDCPPKRQGFSGPNFLRHFFLGIGSITAFFVWRANDSLVHTNVYPLNLTAR